MSKLNIIKKIQSLSEERPLLLAKHIVEIGICQSQATLSAWRKIGVGPAYIKTHDRYLYPADALIEWVERNLVDNSQKPL